MTLLDAQGKIARATAAAAHDSAEAASEFFMGQFGLVSTAMAVLVDLTEEGMDETEYLQIYSAILLRQHAHITALQACGKACKAELYTTIAAAAHASQEMLHFLGFINSPDDGSTVIHRGPCFDVMAAHLNALEAEHDLA